MSWLRALIRVPALVAWTLICYLIVVVSRAARKMAPRWHLAGRNAGFRWWARGFAWLVGMRTRVEGSPPEDDFFLVSNHVGYMDIIVLANSVHAAFVAKADLRSWPALGVIFAAADTIFIDRGRRRDVVRVIERIGRKLDRGLGVVVFPEGTSGRGDGVLPFKPSLLEFAAQREYPVHYASLSYSAPGMLGPTHDVICWWGDAAFLPHFLRLLRLPGFEARVVFGRCPIGGSDRKELADSARAAILDAFTPIE